MFDQWYSYFNNNLSKCQCGCRQGYSTHHYLLVMIEKLKTSQIKEDLVGTLLTDLLKTFDCLKHDLFIAKPAAHGFDSQSLNFIFSYHSRRSHRITANNAYSNYGGTIFSAPQGSILRPLRFNICICDMFLEAYESYIASYADDNTPDMLLCR